jgi:hypothetical protein
MCHPFGILDFWVEPHLARRNNFGTVKKHIIPSGFMILRILGLKNTI